MVKKAPGETIHYISESTEPIFEKRIADGRSRSYVYALGKHLARVDGVIGDPEAKKYWYHTDQVGSVKAVTNQVGAVVWKADYLPFGTQFGKNKLDPEFEEDDLGFTGKGYDKDVGLYYFNARWYDAELGRFISEDPVADPNNPNLYSYARNNPLSIIDPTGLMTLGDVGLANPGGTGYEESKGKTLPDNGMITNTSIAPNPDGSYTFNYTTTENVSPGVTKTVNQSSNYTADGQLVYDSKTIILSKKDGGTVIIDVFTTTNFTYVRYEIRDKDGNTVNVGVVCEITLIGLRGWGSGLETNSSKLKVKDGEQRDKYDDMLILTNADGDIAIFSNCNFESTNYQGKYSDDADALTGEGGDIADGVYVLNYGYHKNYAALWVNK